MRGTEMSEDLTAKDSGKELPKATEPNLVGASIARDDREVSSRAAGADTPRGLASQAAPASARPTSELAPSEERSTAANPKLGIGAEELAGAAKAKGVAVTTGRGASPQSDRQLPGPRVISGEVMPPRRSRRRPILVLLLLAALSAGGYYGFGWWTTGRFIVSTDDAYVAADMSVLAAKVPGLIAAVGVSDNQTVKAGTLLVSIDDGDYKLAVDAAANRLATQDATITRIEKQIEAQVAALAQSKAQLASAQAELVRAEAAFARAQKLAMSDFGTKASLDQARADRDKAVAGITAAQSGLDQAQSMLDVLKAQKMEAVRSRAELVTALDRAKRDLEFTQIRAPFDGVVGNRAVEVGQYVQPGTRVMALVPLGTVRVEAHLKETQLAAVKPGQPVDVSVDAFGGRVITGRVESLSPASGSLFSLLPPENATGNFTKIVQRLTVRIALPDDIVGEGILRPGMSVVVGINTREPGSRVVGEDLPQRFALLCESAKNAALRLFGGTAAAKADLPAAVASGESAKAGTPAR
jgi:membrane fusion protein (multidrug efflux system)